MIRFVYPLALLILVGCGNSSAENISSNPPDATKKMESVTLDKPTEEKAGSISLSEAAKNGGFKPYPGSEGTVGTTYKRGDGGSKDEFSFEVNASLNKVAEFFKGEGLDTKVQGKEATSMGTTKKNVQLMILMNEVSSTTVRIVIKSLRY